jgi:hypothetical protein
MNPLYDLLNTLLPTPGTSAWAVFVGVLFALIEHFLLICMTIYALVLVRRVWRTLAALPQPERTAQRMPLVKMAVARFGFIFLSWWGIFALIGYGTAAMDRKGATFCQRKTSPEYAERYYAELCEVRGDRHGARSLLRLYDATTNSLLAEVFVSNSEGELEWRKTQLNEQGFDVPSKPYIVQDGWRDDGHGTYGVSIELPPPWWDHFMARLP